MVVCEKIRTPNSDSTLRILTYTYNRIRTSQHWILFRQGVIWEAQPMLSEGPQCVLSPYTIIIINTSTNISIPVVDPGFPQQGL